MRASAVRALRSTMVLAVLCFSVAAAGEAGSAAIRLAPFFGPPSTTTQVQGRGFQAGETADISFDHTKIATAKVSQSGTFRKRITVPAPALPGDHKVKATGRSSGFSANATFTVRTDWTRFHFDNANTGVNPYENVLNPSTVSGLVPAWIAPVGRVTTAPAVVNGIVYIGVFVEGTFDGALRALDARTGAFIWERVLTGGFFPSDPTSAFGMVFVGTLDDHTLWAFDAATGTLLWSFVGSGAMGTPAMSGSTLYVATNSSVYALDPRTGQQMWSALVGKPISVEAVAVTDGKVFVASNATVYALDQATGATLWTHVLDSWTETSPAVVDGTVYMGTVDDGLYALDAATGAVKWKSIATGGNVDSSPALSGGLVYAGSTDGNVYAFDVATGDVAWTVPTGDSIGHASPVVSNGVVYIGSKDFEVYALDTLTGQVLWAYLSGADFANAAAVADGVLYIGSFDGNLYAFALP